MNFHTPSTLHPLLLLSDSALPLGSFAFSSGLESFLAHRKSSTSNRKGITIQDFEHFLHQSLTNVSSTALPYVLAAYENPESLQDLDNDFDASTPCTVTRRASISQGKALLSIWKRALCASTPNSSSPASTTLSAFSTNFKTLKPDVFGLGLNAHFPPLFGTVCAAMGLSKQDTAYVFLLNHVKAVLSAAVRLSVLGPYQSQSVLASERVQGWIRGCVERMESEGVVRADDAASAAVTVPVMDLWMGRHEVLYSRIFNS